MTDPTLSEIMERVKAVPDTAFVQPSVAIALVTEIERQASEIERLTKLLEERDAHDDD